MAPKFAFLICGIFQRFFWKDIPLNLVKPLTEKGSTVHIYYSLVNVSTFHVNIGSKEDYKDSAHFHETVFEKSGLKYNYYTHCCFCSCLLMMMN
eukprot:m.68816 g.68816  ORF g.68816 m.68816 type:complete len:94 (-) comp12004_c0_seq2:50-331(-)